MIKSVGNYRPICHTKYGLLAYKREKLYLIDTNNDIAIFLCDFKINDSRQPFCFSNFSTRLMHITAYCGIEVPNGAVVAFNRGIYFINIEEKTVTREHDFNLSDMRRPLNFYKINETDTFDEKIVYGEYSFNSSRCEVSIYGRDNHGAWNVLYSFPMGTVRHIHSIINDPYRDRVLILTGDLDSESAIWIARNNFRTVEKLFGDSQMYRVCCARAYKEGVVMITDSPFDQNYVYFLMEKDNETKLTKIFELPGPTVFFTYYNDYIVFATDVEYDARVVHGFKKYFSYKRGPGVLDWYSHLYIGNHIEGFKEISKFKKDIWPMVTLGFGNIHFPNGEHKDKVYFYPTAVKKFNEKACYFTFDKFERINNENTKYS